MRNLTKLALAGIAVAGLSACQSINTSNGSGEVSAPNLVMPTYEAQVNVDDKATVKADATVHNLFGIFTWGVSEFADYGTPPSMSPFEGPATVARKAAVYRACQAAKCDVLVGTKYVITTDDYFVYKTVKADITGYKGTITGFEKLKPEVTLEISK